MKTMIATPNKMADREIKELKSKLEEKEKEISKRIELRDRRIKLETLLRKQLQNSIPKKCEHKGCKDNDLIVVCHNHINSDYPCINCSKSIPKSEIFQVLTDAWGTNRIQTGESFKWIKERLKL